MASNEMNSSMESDDTTANTERFMALSPDECLFVVLGFLFRVIRSCVSNDRWAENAYPLATTVEHIMADTDNHNRANMIKAPTNHDDSNEITLDTSSDSDKDNDNSVSDYKSMNIQILHNNMYTTGDDSDIGRCRYQRSHFLSSSSSSSSDVPLSQRLVKRIRQLKKRKQQQKKHELEKLNWDCTVKVKRLTKADLAEILNPLAHLPKIPRLKSKESPVESKDVEKKPNVVIMETSPTCSSSITTERCGTPPLSMEIDNDLQNRAEYQSAENITEEINRITEIYLPIVDMDMNEQAIQDWVIPKTLDRINDDKDNISD